MNSDYFSRSRLLDFETYLFYSFNIPKVTSYETEISITVKFVGIVFFKAANVFLDRLSEVTK
jgi:hypothetical protein